VVIICTAHWSLYVPHIGHYMYRPVVTICTAQWSLRIPHSGQYMYRTVVPICTAQWSLYVPNSGHYMYRTVVTICTAQWALSVPPSGHYMYRTVVTICSARWSQYVPHSGHYMYRTVVTICTAQWSLYVPHSGHYMYLTVITICTASLTFSNSTFFSHIIFMCFVWISEQTSIISLYNINWLVFKTETECVYCAVRTGYLYIFQKIGSFWKLINKQRFLQQEQMTVWLNLPAQDSGQRRIFAHDNSYPLYKNSG